MKLPATFVDLGPQCGCRRRPSKFDKRLRCNQRGVDVRVGLQMLCDTDEAGAVAPGLCSSTRVRGRAAASCW